MQENKKIIEEYKKKINFLKSIMNIIILKINLK